MVSLLCGTSGRTQAGCPKYDVKIPEPTSQLARASVSSNEVAKCHFKQTEEPEQREKGKNSGMLGETRVIPKSGTEKEPRTGGLGPGSTSGILCLTKGRLMLDI